MKDLWKYIGTGALSMLVTLGGAWYTVNAQAVTKAEVREMIQPDKELARETFNELKQLRTEVQQLNREVGELKGMLRK